MCQNHIWYRETIVDEKQSDEFEIVCASLWLGQISIPFQGVLYSKKLLAYIIVKLLCVKIIFGIGKL